MWEVFRTVKPHHNNRTGGVNIETYSRLNSPFEFNELTKKEQGQLLEWCGNLEKIKGINQNEDSYSIKHLFEKSENGFYIPNGAMKGAMLSSGFKFSCDAGNVNYKFNVSQRSIDRLRK